jgi:hypothetical protein
VAAHIYERFVPFADDGWEPTTLPGDPAFDLWVYEHVQGELRIIGVNLLSRRSGPQRVWTDRPHHVAQRRTEQLTGFAWTTEPGSKVLKRPAPHTSG